MSNSHANDAMIRRLEKELEERNAAVQGIISTAQDAERDLNDTEKEQISNYRNRMGELKDQLDQLESTADIATQIAQRAKQIDVAVSQARRGVNSEVEYRSAGAYLLDSWKAHTGDREARERLEVFERVAAHQKTGDNLGVIPDPIVGEVVNFIDAARPIVATLSPRDMPSATWHRPKVTGHSAVAAQGTAGAAADEKAELTSQKMTITRLTANAVTYGGYVNVSRQNIDFSSPQALDLVVTDLAAQYAIETEAATATELNASPNTVELDSALGTDPTEEELTKALWQAASNAYNAVKGQGRLVLAVAPDRLAAVGRLFAPVSPRDAQSDGFTAGSFSQGVLGSVSGIPVVMSAGLPTDSMILFSTSAIEVFEQRVGSLQAVEPSVLGVQIAYAGYFTPLTIEAGGIQKIVNAA